MRRRRLLWFCCSTASPILLCCSLADLSAEFEGRNDEDARSGDGGTDARDEDIVLASDATREDAAARCNPRMPFGAVVPVRNVPDQVSGFGMNADETFAYFGRLTESTFYYAPVVAFDELGTAKAVVVEDAGTLVGPTVSRDGRTLYFESGFRLWRATGRFGGPYGDVTALPTFPTAPVELGEPRIDDSGGFLYAVRYVDTGFIRNIVRAPVLDGGGIGAWQSLSLAPESNHSAVPTSTPDALFLAIDRTSFRGADVYSAANVAAADAGVVEVAGVSSSSYDMPMWISRDGCDLYLVSARDTGIDARLYVTRRGR